MKTVPNDRPDRPENVENPEWSLDDMRSARPSQEMFEELGLEMPDRPPEAVRKRAISIRLDPDVIDHFRSTGPGWMTRMNDYLRTALPDAAHDAAVAEEDRETVARLLAKDRRSQLSPSAKRALGKTTPTRLGNVVIETVRKGTTAADLFDVVSREVGVRWERVNSRKTGTTTHTNVRLGRGRPKRPGKSVN